MRLGAGGAAALAGSAALAATCLNLFPSLRGVGARTGPRRLKHLWLPPEGDAPPPPPATRQRIAEIERAIGHRLPPIYCKMLRVQDGGELRMPLWVAPDDREAPMDYFGLPEISGTGGCLAQTPEMVRGGLLPRGLVCVFEGDEWDLCLDYRRAGDSAACVVALDEGRDEYVLADSMESFVAGLTRGLPDHVFAAWGSVGPRPEMLLAELSEALGVRLARGQASAEQYEAELAGWRSLTRPDAPASLRLVRNGFDREHHFPETRSRWLLCCDIHPSHRPDLERRLRATDFRWIVLHAPPRRLVEIDFWG